MVPQLDDFMHREPLADQVQAEVVVVDVRFGLGPGIKQVLDQNSGLESIASPPTVPDLAEDYDVSAYDDLGVLASGKRGFQFEPQAPSGNVEHRCGQTERCT